MTKILGLKKLNRKFKALPDAAQTEMREAIAKSAREITDLAESLVPQDSGALAASIGWTWGDPPKGSMVIAQAKQGDLTATIYVGDDEAYYARWIEFGTQKMAAQPFFFVAYRALRKRSKSRIKRSQRKAAKKVAAS